MILCENCKAQLKVSGILSNRRLEILELVSQGLMDKEIALRLGICIGTVKKHIMGIKDTLECDTKIEAVVKFVEEKYEEKK